MALKIKAEIMHANAGIPDRLVWLVIAPSGRVLAERRTQAGAEAVARRQEG